MKQKYTEYKQLDLPTLGKNVRKFWDDNGIFEKSIETRDGKPQFVFYEGPPSANGLPGIHHVMARAIKDIFCRYKTLKGFQVKRKAGWDTHGLPIEIAVEKTLGITKEDIGKTISVIDYNKACRREVMKYKDKWDDITKEMGYWVDLNDPYITFDNKYIESVWHLLSLLYQKGLLYKGYTIQPYSPAAGTGLSSHELNLPGCYKDVKDTTAVAQFKVVKNQKSEFLFKDIHGDLFFIAWTTTPWTLPSNTALAVGAKINYVVVKTFNQYTSLPITVILAKDLFRNYFPEKNEELKLEDYQAGQKNIPYSVIAEYQGTQLEGLRYEQLLPYAQPEDGDPFRVVVGDFVTTVDGTGIVHIAPSFGADDFRMNRLYHVGALTMVDKQGKFIDAMGEFAGRYVKSEYDANFNPATSQSVDIDIVVKMKKENKCFKTEKYEHSYPHCWRTDKPILYYPLDSWFIKTTAYKERMLELNKTINWKPESTGTGRFGNWLENLVDWNLSRSRFWGVPIPVWTSEDRSEQLCIGSVAELKKEIEKSIAAGFMKENPFASFTPSDNSAENYLKFDIHRPYVDEIILVSPKGNKMFREPDLIDVWFDSGSMPYAQFHYPFENKNNLKEYFPADFIAEGVDQTRGWFFTLHAIATMLFDSVAFKTVVSNGLVLDKAGNKMSKRLGNAVDPFETIEKYGPDATRWYMITNSQPWDNLKFDVEGIGEIQRKFFGTLYNTYNFFAIYANIDNFNYKETEIPIEKRPEIDRWILSQLNSLIKNVDECYNDFEPTKAGRAIQSFVDEHLSNWYVRLCRRRFWKGEYSNDKISAYQTLYRCLEVLSQLMAPIAPFFAERLFLDLNNVSGRINSESIHLTDFPVADEKQINKELEERMQIAQNISSMVLSLRKKVNIRVRQPLGKIMVPALDENFKRQIEAVKNIILSEVNVKELELITNASGILIKKIKPNFKTLGPKFGKMMKQIASTISEFSQNDIDKIEKEGIYKLVIAGETFELNLSDVEIFSEDIPGWLVTNMGSLTVALDITVTEQLHDEGIARELINRIQNIRKESQFEVTDKISLLVEKHEKINSSIRNNNSYICAETLAVSLNLVDSIDIENSTAVELVDDISTKILVKKV
ncbi:MAG TPA: isoleucine--tRNA ligase [Bacteroidales bacterium]|nr:isoleucine--tRNA ligase [Bacteroidales bacterium]HPS16660.1 isoleucine--tRNA ligase [Bacteroidales bacterium]